mmetsp:Transcript_19507/g.27212  ORF Transcript_19507/g.27212 Transcript_19507/m.27212 type:complete len:254 (-) Transcript_19507:63-824(-)
MDNTLQVDLLPAQASDVKDILRINLSYFPSESLTESVKIIAEKDLGLLVSKFSEKDIDDGLINFLVIVKKPTREVIGYIQTYRTPFGHLYATEEEYTKDKDTNSITWTDTKYRHIVMAPHEKDVNDPPINREDYQTIWIAEVCSDQVYIGKNVVKAAYDVLFENPNLSLPRWTVSAEGKSGQKPPVNAEYPPISAKKLLYFCWIVRKPYDNARSLRFHMRQGFHKVAEYNGEAWDDLKNPGSELYVKEVDYHP